MLWLINTITGGRPMTLMRRDYFRDRRNGRMVHVYRDYFGRYWMAYSACGLLRAPYGGPQ